jgi:hypothetical protein
MKKLFQSKIVLFSTILVAVIIFGGFTMWALSTVNTGLPSVATTATTTPQSSLMATTSPLVPAKIYQYLEVVDGCGPALEGTCVNMRSGPSTTSPVFDRLRTGVVLKVEGTVTNGAGQEWYKIGFDATLRYPERVAGGLYVLADAVQLFTDDGLHNLTKDSPPTNKRIVVSLSKEMLYAYDGDTLFMHDPVSTGLEFTPTPLGTFTIYRKTPARYMQGPIPGVSNQYYDLPGVPWDLYFTTDGAVIHGAYWHNHFGEPWSHGCVNLAPQEAKKLYYWAVAGTKVTVEK